MKELPEIFLERLEKIVPSACFKQVLATFSCANPVVFWINPLKRDPLEVLSELKKEFNLAELEGFNFTYAIDENNKRELTESKWHLQGEIYLQNPASMYAAFALSPKSDQQILDLCAAPGSKTILLSALTNNLSQIAAVELVKDRFFRLKANLEKNGAKNVRLFHKDGRRVGKLCPERFDKVLLDAPCSSSGRFSILEPESFQFWNLKKVKEAARKQFQLLISGLEALKVGGELLYSTCSYEPEENEEIVDRILEKFAGKLELVELAPAFLSYQKGLSSWREKEFAKDLAKTIRILPNEFYRGFYLAKFKKLESI